jgi:alpha-ribazole phosphatase/probable phosphoglycerate mutase
MSRLFLIRHARTEMAGRFCGATDPPLSAEGIAQLPPLVQKLQGIVLQHIFSSDLLRARQTAEALAANAQRPICLLPELREMHFGRWEGLTWQEIEAQYPGYAQRWLHSFPQLTVPGGEEFEQFRSRVQKAMETILDRLGDSCAAVVTHAGVIRANLLQPLGVDPNALTTIACDYTSVWEWQSINGAWRLLE